MKKNIILGLVVLLAILAVSSCSIFGGGTSMTDRIGLFVGDLNGSRANIIDNIHPDAPGYNTANSDSYWSDDAGPWDPVDNTFSITNITEGSDSVTGTFTSKDFPGGTTIFFEMKDDGDFFAGEDWKIWSCTVDGVDQF